MGDRVDIIKVFGILINIVLLMQCDNLTLPKLICLITTLQYKDKPFGTVLALLNINILVTIRYDYIIYE